MKNENLFLSIIDNLSKYHEHEILSNGALRAYRDGRDLKIMSNITARDVGIIMAQIF